MTGGSADTGRPRPLAQADLARARPLEPAEDRAFRVARLFASQKMPYFSHALFAMRPVALPGLDTFGVDPHWRLYMDPALLDGPGAWPAPLAGAVLLHEAGHLIRDHAGRAESLPAPQHLAWNLAGDAEINDDLAAAGIILPDGVVTPAALGLAPDKLAEEYYALLARQDLTRFDGGPGCGSGAGVPAEPGELPWSLDAGTPGLGTADADLVRRTVAADVRRASQSRGTVPAGLERWASQTLATPAVPWQQLLRGTLRRVLASEAGRVDYTYKRPSRHRVPGIIRPGMRAPALTVAVVVDTSGSMSESQLAAALAEISGLLSSSGIARGQVSVLACDAEAAAPQKVRSAADVRLTGGGGTDMRIGIDAAARMRPAPHVIIVLTDGYTPWPSRPTRQKLVCAVISGSPPRGTPGWAVTVHVPDSPARSRALRGPGHPALSAGTA